MADATAKFESAQALFCAIADHIGKDKINNVLNVDTYPTYEKFKKGTYKKQKHIDIITLAEKKTVTPGVDLKTIESFLKDKGWYTSSVKIAKKMIKELGALKYKGGGFAKFKVLDAAKIAAGYVYVRGDTEIMKYLEELFKVCNENNKTLNATPGAAKEVIYGDTNKWSPADIYYAHKDAKLAIKKEREASKKKAAGYNFARLNRVIKTLIKKGLLLPLSLKKQTKSVTIELVNFDPDAKAELLSNVNYLKTAKNESSPSEEGSTAWVKAAPRMGKFNDKGMIKAESATEKKLRGKEPMFDFSNLKEQSLKTLKGKITKWPKNNILSFGKLFDLWIKDSKIFASVFDKLSVKDQKIYKDYEYNYLEFRNKKYNDSRWGTVPMVRKTDPRDMNIQCVKLKEDGKVGSTVKGTIQMRHDPSTNSWKVDYKYQGAEARGGSVVSHGLFKDLVAIIDSPSATSFHSKYKEGEKKFKMAMTANGGSLDIYKALGLTKFEWHYYGPGGLENDPPMYLWSRKQITDYKNGKAPQFKKGFNKARLQNIPWKSLTIKKTDKGDKLDSNAFDYQRGEISSLCLVNLIMPPLCKMWKKLNKQRQTDVTGAHIPNKADFLCQVIFKYVTSRSDTAARFVIAK